MTPELMAIISALSVASIVLAVLGIKKMRRDSKDLAWLRAVYFEGATWKAFTDPKDGTVVAVCASLGITLYVDEVDQLETAKTQALDALMYSLLKGDGTRDFMSERELTGLSK